MIQVRKPAVSNMFYPGNSEKLKDIITSFLNEFPTHEFKNVHGIISPHAGYVYSGKTAAAAYKTLIGKKYDTVIVISPSHREYFRGISIFPGEAYLTPLGEIKIDEELRKKFKEESSKIILDDTGHRAEHALEVQLPFLQMVLNKFKLLPIVLGDQNKTFVDELSRLLKLFWNENILIVASSDLSHFYTKEKARVLDSKVAWHIEKFDYENLYYSLENEECYACGGGGIVALLKTFSENENYKSKVLMQTDSGDVTGDNSEVVGYLSAVIYS